MARINYRNDGRANLPADVAATVRPRTGRAQAAEIKALKVISGNDRATEQDIVLAAGKAAVRRLDQKGLIAFGTGIIKPANLTIAGWSFLDANSS